MCTTPRRRTSSISRTWVVVFGVLSLWVWYDENFTIIQHPLAELLRCCDTVTYELSSDQKQNSLIVFDCCLLFNHRNSCRSLVWRNSTPPSRKPLRGRSAILPATPRSSHRRSSTLVPCRCLCSASRNLRSRWSASARAPWATFASTLRSSRRPSLMLALLR